MTEPSETLIDMAAIRRVAAALQAEQAAVCQADGLPDGSKWLGRFAARTFDSYEDLVGKVRDGCDPDGLPLVVKLCAKSIGGTGTTRTLTGRQRVNSPFFHHGDLVVAGHLDLSAPLVVTGSLTVEGCLYDAGPDSLLAVGGGLKARGVRTDGDLFVRGDLEAEVVYGCYNDHTLQAGRIHGRLVIEDDHEVVAYVEAEHHFDSFTYEQGYGDGVQAQLRALLVDEVFTQDEDDEEEMLDPARLFTLLEQGTPVFRADVLANQ